MPEYRILPDDRGWPMAHLIQPDGTIDRNNAGGAMIGLEYADVTAVVAGIPVPGTRLTVQWFLVGRNDYWAGDWELGLPATMANPPGPDDRDIALEIFGRPARGAWCGPYRINGRLPFPLSWDEWTSVRTEGSRR